MTGHDLALHVLPRFADGHWHPAAPDIAPSASLWQHFREQWRVYRALRLCGVGYERPAPGDMRPWIDRCGWLRITAEGRLALAIARDIEAKGSGHAVAS